MLSGKTILLGVTGGIASYKAAALCSRLKQAGADVRVIMTDSAVQFVAPLTFQTLSRRPVYLDTFDEKDASGVSHIDLADSADLVVIAPATANMIGKMANGLADDMLSTTLLAVTAPILIAPAMNVHMYDHPAVRSNMAALRQRGVHFAEPNEGQLACGYIGKGRLAEPEQLFDKINSLLNRSQSLQGKSVLVTAGGTRERIDPVRYLTNDSSGIMGYRIAEAARDRGAVVRLISGKTALDCPSGVERMIVESAEDMLVAVQRYFPTCDILIKAAAVADYRPAQIRKQKIKKSGERLMLELEKTTDILQWTGDHKSSQFIVGFAAETERIDEYALDKLHRKHCDLIAANDVTLPGAGFESEQNAVKIFDENGLVEEMALRGKTEVAGRLVDLISDRIRTQDGNRA